MSSKSSNITKHPSQHVFKRKLLNCPYNMHDSPLVSPQRRHRLKKPRPRTNGGLDLFRRLERVWNHRVGEELEGDVDEGALIELFHDLQLYPSRAQVHEMVKCSSAVSQQCHGTERHKVGFPEFSVYASELYRLSVSGCSRRIVSRFKDRSKNGICNNKNGCKWEVFLGGSCNPTTWRRDTAIPTLEALGISFYNPQVSNWAPSLVELEAEAKSSASVMLFVVERETRAVVSCIEAAHLSGYHDKLVLVMEHIIPGQKLQGESISPSELNELSWSRAVIQDLLEKQDIPVLSCLQDGLQVTSRLVKNSQCASQVIADFTDPVKLGHVPLGDKLMKLYCAFNSLDSNNSGYINRSDLLYDVNVNPELLPTSDSILNFDQFCLLLVKLRSSCQQGRRLWDSLASEDSRSSPSSSPLFGLNGNTSLDLYLGAGSPDAPWLKNTAIPLIKQAGISYHYWGGHWAERLLPLETEAMDRCRVLLWVISDCDRCFGSMCLAAHYIGLGCRVILCIQTLSEGVVIQGEKLSVSAVKDYNRGRVYLKDMAERENVPVYDNIDESVQAAIRMCKR